MVLPSDRTTMPPRMIRNVVLVKLKADHDAAVVAEIQKRLRGLDGPAVRYTVGNDAWLRD
jgi:hypothetical protein